MYELIGQQDKRLAAAYVKYKDTGQVDALIEPLSRKGPARSVPSARIGPNTGVHSAPLFKQHPHLCGQMSALTFDELPSVMVSRSYLTLLRLAFLLQHWC